MTLSPAIAALFDLTGQSALVTGASGAFGAAAARALAGAGAHVTLAGAKAEALASVKAQIENAGGAASICVGRPDSEAACDAMAEAATAHGGGLDILVVASGLSIVKTAIDMTPEEFSSVQDANVRQSWLITRAAGRRMIDRQRGGRVILVSSVRASFAAPAGTTAYGASKAAVDMLTRSFATEWGQHQITVNAIAPTVFRSDLTSWMYQPENEARRARTLARIPLGRLAEPDDFAGAILFLAARAGAYVTGEILRVDGGFSAN